MSGLGLIIVSNLNRVTLSCCWVGVGLGCDNLFTSGDLFHQFVIKVFPAAVFYINYGQLIQLNTGQNLNKS